MAEETKAVEQEEHSRLGDFVKLAILAWSMAILTANYLGVFKQSLDPTYPASLLSGTAASFGLALGRKKKDEPKIKETAGPTK
jgi:hypothetical protein